MAPAPSLLIFGLGYTGEAVAREASARGWRVWGTHRTRPQITSGPVTRIGFDDAEECFAAVSHILLSIPPQEDGDPVLTRYAAALQQNRTLRWIGYYSTTGVYGDHNGATVTESTPPSPTQPRSLRRLNVENDWRALATASGIACDIMRLGGIYGPGRSALDAARNGTARLIEAPEHLFSRIHRDDIVGATLAAIDSAQGNRVLNFVDSHPSTQMDVNVEAYALLSRTPPAPISLREAWESMSTMGRSFWSERRAVSSALTQRWIGRNWRYPSYQEGLRAIFNAENRPSGA